MRSETDILIVGGGVAGLALAARLGAAGHAVLVLDKAPLPRDKVCGEGIMPMGIAALRAVGLEATALPGAPFSGLEYRSRRQQARLPLRPALQGRGMRRTTLIRALDALVQRCPTVERREDHARGLVWRGGRIVGVRGVRGTYRAPVVVAADGVHAGLARRAGLALRPRGERMALRRHYRLPPGTLPAHVGVGLFAPHDVYLTPVGADELLATCMTDRAGCRAVRDDYDGFLRRSPYGDLFANATPAGAVLAWHHPLFVPRAYHTGGMLLVGDAGGGVDPCLGVGLSMALASALFAAEAVPGMLAEPPRRAAWLHHFDRRRKLLFRHFDLFGRLFCLAVRSPRGSEALLWGMRHWPGIAAQLLDIVAAGRPWRGFAWSALLEPLVGGLSGGAPPPEGVLELGAPDPAESGELMGRQ